MLHLRKNILYIENDATDRLFVKRFAEKENLLGCNYTLVGSVKEAVGCLEREDFDAVVLNYPLEDTTAFAQFEKVNTVPVILVMRVGDQDIAIAATKARADSYLIKDPEGNYLKLLPLFLDRAIKQNKDAQEIKKLRAHLQNFEMLAAERIIEMQKEIDAQKQPDKQLQIFQHFTEASSQGIVIATVFGIITCGNPAFAKIVGEDNPEAAVGKSLFAYYPDTLQQRLQNEIFPAVLQEGHWSGELGLLGVKGDRIPDIENYLFVIRDKNRTPIYLANLLTDNTKHKRAAAKIKHKHDIQGFLNTMLAISLRPCSLLEMLDNILERLSALPGPTMESRGAIFLVEGKPDKLVLKSSRGLPGDIQTKWAQVPFGSSFCGQAARTKKIQFSDSIDPCHGNRAGQIPLHGRYCVPILSNGRVLGVMTLYLKGGHRRNQEVEDFLFAIASGLAGIIERKRAEEGKKQLVSQLMRSRKMDVIGRFTDEITQAFNPLLSAIIGYAELALFNMDQNAPQRNTIENIYYLGLQAAAFNKQLVAISGKQNINSENLCLNAKVKGMQMILVGRIGEERRWIQ
jgi:PAS domain-containing protein/putative methionine-R-sulfoxide reductase with GAF domain